MLAKKRRPVIFSGIDPTVKEVVVTIRESDGVIEEVIGGLLVELGTRLFAQTMPGDMEVSILGPLDPVFPLSSLETMSWPVPGILGFDDVELTIEAEGHGVVTNLGAGTVHDHWVQTIESHDTEEVTRLDKIWVDIDDLGLTLNKVDSSLLREEFNVGLFHVFRNMGTDVRKVWVSAKTTNEGLHGVEKRLEIFNNRVTESISLDAAITYISLNLRGVHLELEAVGSLKSKDLEVLDLGVSEHDGILAHQRCWIFCGYQNLEVSLIDGLVLEADLLVAGSSIRALRIGRGDISGEDGKQLAEISGASKRISVTASVDRSGSASQLFGMLVGVLKVGLLLNIVHMERKKRGFDSLLNMSVWEDGLFNKTSELVLGNISSHWLDSVSDLPGEGSSIAYNVLEQILAVGDANEGGKGKGFHQEI